MSMLVYADGCAPAAWLDDATQIQLRENESWQMFVTVHVVLCGYAE
jgi:hypothetical protein